MSLRHDDELGLIRNGFQTVKIPPCKAVSGAVSTHADLLLFFLRDKLFLPKDYYTCNSVLIDEILRAGGLSPVLTRDIPRSPYPHEVPLCALNISDAAVIASKKHIAPEIVRYCEDSSIPILNTNQGYAKCTAAYMGGIISADRSTLSAAKANNIPCLEISQGNVLLDGYPYGFIGGASGFDGQNIYFCGNVDLHPDGHIIKAFCDGNGIGCISLSDLPLYDIGSIFFI